MSSRVIARKCEAVEVPVERESHLSTVRFPHLVVASALAATILHDRWAFVTGVVVHAPFVAEHQFRGAARDLVDNTIKTFLPAAAHTPLSV